MFRTLRFGQSLCFVIAILWGCSDESSLPARAERESESENTTLRQPSEDNPVAVSEQVVERDFPLHGLVKRAQIVIRDRADPDSTPRGWLRWGQRIRLGTQRVRTSTCNSGFYPLAPRGWVCIGQGIEIGQTPPPPEEPPVSPADQERTLPYLYFFVKEPMVPEYYQLPSREVQRAAQAFADDYLALLARDESRAERLLKGESAGLGPPAAVSRYFAPWFFCCWH